MSKAMIKECMYCHEVIDDSEFPVKDMDEAMAWVQIGILSISSGVCEKIECVLQIHMDMFGCDVEEAKAIIEEMKEEKLTK